MHKVTRLHSEIGQCNLLDFLHIKVLRCVVCAHYIIRHKVCANPYNMTYTAINAYYAIRYRFWSKAKHVCASSLQPVVEQVSA